LGSLSLDTNVLIELVNGRRPSVRERYLEAQHRGETLVMSALVWEELRFGVHRGRMRGDDVLHRLMQPITVVAFERKDADVSAQLRADLENRGERVGSYDSLIAAHAVSRGWTMVTANVREFGRVPGLELVDWTAPVSVRQE
jgi:tRNA(fMet)-specific endonuclease VapC